MARRRGVWVFVWVGVAAAAALVLFLARAAWTWREAARACIVRTFAGLSFPPPQGGIVTATFPYVLAPP